MSQTPGATGHVQSTDTDTAATTEVTIAWLQDQFPDWTIELDRSESWDGESRPLWIARKEGHHPQAELSAAKLHTRLSDYLEREEQRRALMN
ncbi:MAG: hypothetical protein ACLFRD_07680 [Nitriliruptoraceae bacterium]